MSQMNGAQIGAVLGQFPVGHYVVTAAADDRRSGVITPWIQRCAVEPPLIVVAMPSGMPVEPLIHNSRSFGLCQVTSDDRLIHRSFTPPMDINHDPFDLLCKRCGPLGSPIIERSISAMQCELVRTVDLDADHRLYVGRVVAAEILRPELLTDARSAPSPSCSSGPTPRNGVDAHADASTDGAGDADH